MDLRQLGITAQQAETAERVLNYQPFVISDDVQTGVAYSWLHTVDPRVAPPLVFRRNEWESEWEKITEANDRLRHMYDDFIAEIARRFPGRSLLDVACNNGYFPVRAALSGMGDCVGSDLGTHYADSLALLREVTGAHARFIGAPYDPVSGTFPINDRFDVAVAAAILCHLPDPLRFLAALGSVATKAIFFWGQMLDTEELVVSLWKPHSELSKDLSFPYTFNDNTRISRGLFREAVGQMGFDQVVFLEPRPYWLFSESVSTDLREEIRVGSAHVAAIAIRNQPPQQFAPITS